MANISTSLTVTTTVTGPIRLLAGKSGAGLYLGKTVGAQRSKPPFYRFETVLTPFAVDDGANALAQAGTITIPQPLPPAPAWDVWLAGDGSATLAAQSFGGAWNRLIVGPVKDGEVAPAYVFTGGDCGAPRFVRSTAPDSPGNPIVSAILGRQKLGLFLPQPADDKGQIAVNFLPLTEASYGVVFGDLASGLPAGVSLVYKTDRRTGPLSPGGLFTGQLALAGYDLSKKTLATPQPILAGLEIAEFDAAIQEGVYCLAASTGDGALLLAAFDSGGKPLGRPYLPAGPWNGVNRWIANPCIVADPQGGYGNTLGFRIAFILFDGNVPTGVYTDTVAVSPTGGVTPPPSPADGG
jgi:hypothetical protein